MYRWLALPMVRASLAFTLGVLLGLQSDFSIVSQEILWLGLLLVYWLTLRLTRGRYGAGNIRLFIIASSLLFLSGMIRSRQQIKAPEEIIGQAEFYYATVIEPTSIHGNYYSTTLTINEVWKQRRSHEVNDQLIIYQRLNGYVHLNFGDQLIASGAPGRIRTATNPYQFDYARFMSRKNVFWYHWIDSTNIIEHLTNRRISLNRWSYDVKETLSAKLEKYLPGGVSREIANAMLLGNRSALTDDTKDAFARSGTIHVLAVSGLHLGIIYWVLLQIIGRWRHHRILKWLFIMVSLLVLWGFTMVTGMAPSTQRAATMFSVLLLGNVFSQQSNTVNTLAVAGIVILWVDPYQLYSVGCQLSFLALGGILYLQPLINSWWKPENRLLKYFWQLSSVSLAAQITVCPLSVFYFHQLPVYFLLANMVLIPLTFAIVAVGIVFFLSSMSHLFAVFTATPLAHLSNIAAYLVQVISNFPGSTLKDLYIDQWEVCLWYGILVSLVSFLSTRLRVWWFLLMSMVLVVSGNNIYHRFQLVERQLMVVYQIPGGTAIDFIDRDMLYSVIDPRLANSPAITYNIENYRKSLNLKNLEQPVSLWENSSLADMWLFKGKSVLLIKKQPRGKFDGEIKLKAHITIVSNNSVKHLDQINSLKTDLLIIDGSNHRGLAQKLESQANKVGIEVHNGWSKGFKIINL